MKKIVLLVLFPIFAFAQKVSTGIYELNYDTDTTFVHQFIPKFNEQNRYGDIKFVYKHHYESLIDKAHKIKYAVVINKQISTDKENYKLEMVWLNSDEPTNYNVSYSDNSVRKFLKFDISVDLKTLNWYESTEKEDGFLKYYNIDKHNENDYDIKYSDAPNFGIYENQFLLKSSHYKVEINRIKVDSSSYYNNPLVGSGFKKGINYATVNQKVTAFKLKKSKNYKNFLPIQRDSVNFYSSIDKKKFIILNAGDFIALTKETNEWYYGDHISVDGKAVSGAIFIDDLSKSDTKIRNTNSITLKIKYHLYEEGQSSWNNEGEILRIKTYFKNKLIQVLKNPGLVNNKSKIIDFQDVNFDGYQDLVVFAHDGGAGPNFGNNYYVFNPKNKQFDFNEALSNLTQPEVNNKTKTIYAAWRDGAATHGWEKYKWIKNKLTLVEFYETEYLDEKNVRETHEYLINGKMNGKTKTVKENKLNPPKLK